jgi:hypothetical protein
MSIQQKRLRRAPRYNHRDSPIISVIYALAREYHCTVLESRGGRIAIRCRGRVMKLGTVDAVKSMSIRGLTGIFEELTQDWRYEPMNTEDAMIQQRSAERQQ